MGAERERWLAERKKYVTSTDVAKILGLSSYGTALHVYEDKTDPEVRDGPPTPHQEAGLLLEPLVARLYGERTGARLARVSPYELHTRNGLGPLACSLDYQAHEDDGPVPTEVKTVGSWDGWGDEGTDEVRADYLVQAHAQMLVLDSGRVNVAALHRGTLELRAYRVRPSMTLARQILDAAHNFWGHVQRREPPAPNFNHPLTAKLLSALRPTPGLACTLAGEADALVRRYEELRAIADAAEDERGQVKARLLHLMGPAEAAHFSNGWKLRRIPVAETTYTATRKEHVQLRLTKPRGDAE